MFGIQTSQTRLALAPSVTLNNRENLWLRDKYSGTDQGIDNDDDENDFGGEESPGFSAEL
jgi:hypothetical protein